MAAREEDDDDRNARRRRRRRRREEREPFEQDPLIQERVQILVNFTRDYDKGHVLLWEIIEGLLGLDWRDTDLRYAVTLWRKHLYDERDIVTIGVHGVGIRLVPDGDVTRVVARIRMKRAYKQHVRVVKDLKKTDLSKLTDLELKMRIMTLDANREAASKARKDLKATSGRPKEHRESVHDIAIAKAKERAAAEAAKAEAKKTADDAARAAKQQPPAKPPATPPEPPTAPTEGGTEPTPPA